MPISACAQVEGRCSFCGSVSQTIRVYQCPSARKTRWTVLGVPSSGRCRLILRTCPSFLGTMRCFLSSCKEQSLPYCLSWRECHWLPCLKRGKPTFIASSLRARKRLRDLVRRSASICTVQAGTCSPPRPAKNFVKSYLLGKVPFSSYCAFVISSISLYRMRYSRKQCTSKAS